MDMGSMGGMDMGEGNGYCLGDGMVMNNGFGFMTGVSEGRTEGGREGGRGRKKGEGLRRRRYAAIYQREGLYIAAHIQAFKHSLFMSPYSSLSPPPKGGSCILYLFQGAVVNTAGKYSAAIIGTFFLAFSVEALRHFRFWMRLRRARQTSAAVAAGKEGREGGGGNVRAQVLPILLEAFLFGSHMFIAYLVMLLVMLYEWAIFISLVLGLTTGYFTMEMWEAYR